MPEVTRPLPLSLEELYSGTTKFVTITRNVFRGTEEKTLRIDVVPGWKDGTKIRFEKAGDEVLGVAQDLVFKVEQKNHPMFTRVQEDLQIRVNISLTAALTNPRSPNPSDPSPLPQTVKTLDSREIAIPLPSGMIKPGQTTRIPNEGMPRRAKGVTIGRGDLIIRWFIVYPGVLTRQQRMELTRVLNQ